MVTAKISMTKTKPCHKISQYQMRGGALENVLIRLNKDKHVQGSSLKSHQWSIIGPLYCVGTIRRMADSEAPVNHR